MILLDTNYLIRLLVAGSGEERQVDAWLEEQQSLGTSSICWYEFCSGPIDTEGIEIVHALLGARILPFDAATAVEASLLFNWTGGAGKSLGWLIDLHRGNTQHSERVPTRGGRWAARHDAEFGSSIS